MSGVYSSVLLSNMQVFTCLLYQSTVAVLNVSNVKRHYETKHKYFATRLSSTNEELKLFCVNFLNCLSQPQKNLDIDTKVDVGKLAALIQLLINGFMMLTNADCHTSTYFLAC